MSTQCIIGIVIAVIAAVAVIVLAFKSRKNKLVEDAFSAPAVETPDTGKETTIVAEGLVEGNLDEVEGTIVLPVHEIEPAPVPAKTKRKPAVKKDATAVKTKKEPKVKTSKTTKTKVTKPATKPATKKAPAKSKNTVEVKVSTKTTGRKTKK